MYGDLVDAWERRGRLDEKAMARRRATIAEVLELVDRDPAAGDEIVQAIHHHRAAQAAWTRAPELELYDDAWEQTAQPVDFETLAGLQETVGVGARRQLNRMSQDPLWSGD
jgi:hypothetical protein